MLPPPAPVPPAEAAADEEELEADEAEAGGEAAAEEESEAAADEEGEAAVVEGVEATEDDGIVEVYEDELGPMPPGWCKKTDADGDTWYYNSEVEATSWSRPGSWAFAAPAQAPATSAASAQALSSFRPIMAA